MTSEGYPTIANVDRSRTGVFVLPGNHDRFSGVLRRPGGVHFDRVFANYWIKGLGGVQCLLLPKSDGTLGLVAADACLNSTTAWSTSMWGQGECYAPTLAAFEHETVRLRGQAPDAAIVWLLHFPPFLDIEPELRLRSAEFLLDKARSLKVRHIIAGHLHRDQEVDYAGVKVTCTGSAASDLRRQYGNSIRVFDFEVDANGYRASSILYPYDRANATYLAV